MFTSTSLLGNDFGGGEISSFMLFLLKFNLLVLSQLSGLFIVLLGLVEKLFSFFLLLVAFSSCLGCLIKSILSFFEDIVSLL